MGRKRLITLLVTGMICTSVLTGCTMSKKEDSDTSKEVEMASVPQQEEENKEVVDDSTVNKESNEQKEEARRYYSLGDILQLVPFINYGLPFIFHVILYMTSKKQKE